MAKTAAMATADDNKLTTQVKSWPTRVKTFYNDVRTEMKKVTTPSRKEVQATTVVVIVTVFIFGAYFWLVDTAIAHSLDVLLRKLSNR
ncbi:MAG TPA: preprotein translocase subunit SecE [Terriglobales bacterium]|jgi:preprotein translocase subunit SecE|nr:preprotein translocase subunit SecE [Terriglobales bacterium]